MALACSGGGPQNEPYLDLVAAFPEARSRVETRSIVFGSPEGRHHLVSGWAGDEMDAQRGQTFVWSSGRKSVLRFERLEPAHVEVTLSCRPWRSPEGSPQFLSIELNGNPLESLELARGLQEYKLALPARSLRAGENLLSFEYGAIRTDPDQGGERDRRSLGAAWYRVDFGAPGATGAPAADPERDLVFVPYGTEVAYLTYLRPGTSLVASRVGFRGAPGTARVLLETDHGEAGEVARLDPSEQLEVALAAPAGLESTERLPARVVVRARGETGEQGEGGLVLYSPRLATAPSGETEGSAPPPVRSAGRQPHLIVYLIDTLRADRLGAYGYERPISPNLDAFAESAVLFENGIGQSSWTRSSIASMFTGLWPGDHGAVGRRDKLAPEAHTLAEALQAGGYHTTAFITNPNVEATFGFDQGFDDFIHARRGTASNRVNERVSAWLDGYEGDKPFFLYIHTVDPHDPYVPPEEFRRRWAPDSEAFVTRVRNHRRRETWEATPEVLTHLNALYDAEIAFNDDSFGKLMAELRERGLYEDSLIVVISDHGEEFHDHGRWTHGKTLYAETVDFPLIVRFPGQSEGRRSQMPAQHVDLMPTLLEAAGLPIPESVEGRSLSPALAPEGSAGRRPRPVFSHLHLDGPLYVSVVDDGWKLIQRRARDEPVRSTLFDLVSDPGELEDRWADYPVRGAVLAALIEAKLRRREFALDTEEAVLDQELEDSLRALGYLQ